MSKIALVDYNVGNLSSVRNAFKAVGHEVTITADPAVIAAADGLVLPGVGAYGACMANLERAGLVEPVKAYAASGRPLLGICVGHQLLFEAGMEFGRTQGLGLLPGVVSALPDTVKLPQIGWNLVEPVQKQHPVFAGLTEPYYAYFVHTYAVAGADPDHVAATTEYGRVYPSVVATKNLVGIQFHPEKSSRAGLSMLANWGKMVCSSSTRQSI